MGEILSLFQLQSELMWLKPGDLNHNINSWLKPTVYVMQSYGDGLVKAG